MKTNTAQPGSNRRAAASVGTRGRSTIHSEYNIPVLLSAADHAGSYTAELAVRLAAVARSVPSAKYAKLAVDALSLAESVHRLADQLALALESEAR